MTTTTAAQTERVLIYDGDCPMCRATIGLLLRSRLVRPDQTRSNHDLQGADLATAEAARLRNELVVLDTRSRETRSGTDGILWAIGDNLGNPPWVRLLSLSGFRHVLRWGYQVISYNRRIISPPRSQIVCDCEPEVTLARRLSLVVPCLAIALAIVGAFGAAGFYGGELGAATEGAMLAVAAIGGASGLLIVAALVTLKADKAIDYIGHLSVTLVVAALVLLPAALVALVAPRWLALGVTALAALAAFALSVAMQRRRLEALKLPRLWLAGWTLAIVAAITAVTIWYQQ